MLLYCLEGLASLDDSTVLRAMADPVPGIRENAIRLSEGFPTTWPPSTLPWRMIPFQRFALQAILSLGAIDTPNRIATIVGSAHQRMGDEWFRLAVLCGARNQQDGEEFKTQLGLVGYWNEMSETKEEVLEYHGVVQTEAP